MSTSRKRLSQVLSLAVVPFLVTVAPISTKGFDTEAHPNIVIILADDLGYGDLGGSWGGRADTPHLTRLAREGLRFTDFHSNGPMCTPTRAALLTGRYQQRLGIERAHAIRGRETDLGIAAAGNENEITMATYLRRAGYATGVFGKWHLGKHPSANPVQHGFDEFRGLTCGDGDYFSKLDRFGDRDWFHNETLESQEGYATAVITDNAVRFINQHADRPFFLYVAHLAVHFPWQTPDDDVHPTRIAGVDYTSGKPGPHSKLGPHSPDDIPTVMQRMIKELDASVGQIVAALGEKNLDRRTLLFFTSDNGAYKFYLDPDYIDPAAKEFPEPDWPVIGSNGVLRGQKTQLYEGGHRVPAIAWWPGRIAPGSVTSETTMTMDLLPTVLDLIDIDHPSADGPNALDGLSLQSLLLEGEPLSARTLYWRTPSQKAVRQGPWKLVGDELYNLADDLAESRDLAATLPDLVNSLKASQNAWETELQKPK
jgi:arylsulfatase A